MTDIITPTFLIGGAPKAGTSSLYHYLDQHPDVCMSARKETGVFMENYDKGLEWLSDNYYRHYDGESAVGEASAGVMQIPECAERIHSTLPEVQLIFLLRDPVERIYSHYRFLRSVGDLDPDDAFSDLIRDKGTWWRRTQIDLGRYHKHLVRFEQYFDRDQMLVLLFDNLTSNAPTFVERVYRFVGVDPTFRPDLEAHNQTREPKFRGLHRWLTRLWKTVREHVGVYVANETRPLRQAVKTLITQNADPDTLSQDDEAYLRDIYREPNRRLEEWLGRDLSHWQ